MSDENNNRIKDIINLMSISKCKSFYLEYIKKLIPDLSLEDIANKLDLLCREGLITLQFEVRCPRDFTILKVVKDFTEIVNTRIYCRKCDKEVYINSNSIYNRYFIND